MKHNRRGVTLIEMLVVVTIIALFSGLVINRYFDQVAKARVTLAREQIGAFETALGIHKLSTGSFPTNEQGLELLRPYLAKRIPNDPWGHPYIYRNPGAHSTDPEILSYGADGQPGGLGDDADISNDPVN